MSKAQTFPLGLALETANEVMDALQTAVERIEVVGSIARRVSEVRDIDLIAVPRIDEVDEPGTLPGFEPKKIKVDMLDSRIAQGIREGVFEPITYTRPSDKDAPGLQRLVHIPTGIRVDILTTNQRDWWNILVVRSYGREAIRIIKERAFNRGFIWLIHGPGFKENVSGRIHRMANPGHVFQLVELAFREPWEDLAQ